MPFKKITRGKKKGKYRSPSGKTWTLKQIRAYKAGAFGRKSKGRRRRR